MKSDTTHSTFAQPEAETAVYLFDEWFDPIETCVRDRVREFIQAMIEGELDATLLRPRYGRLAKHAAADTHVAMEATGVYWKPVWHIIDGHCVHAGQGEDVPGR